MSVGQSAGSKSAGSKSAESNRDSPHGQFQDSLRAALDDGAFVSLALGKYRGGEAGLRRVLARRVEVQGAMRLSLVYRYQTRDVTKNYDLPEGIAEVATLLAGAFHHGHLVTASEDIQLASNRRGVFRLQRGKVTGGPVPTLAHDRDKARLLELGRPFLAALGIATRDGRLVPSMVRKWKQVNKFLEILEHALEAAGLAGRKELRVIDFGAGKGYLTFAVHDYLRNSRNIAARVSGVELRPDLVALCNEVAAAVGAEGLSFETGSIRSRVDADAAADPIDILIALHACDTATDEAMALGVRAGASVILCSPCCHKEVRPQMLAPPVLGPLLKHGIHLGQEAELVTDGLRALLLQAEGYDTQVFEFVSLEHTSKNKMILALRRGDERRDPDVLAQVHAIKSFYGIREQRLESLLAVRRGAAPGSGEPGGTASLASTA